MIVKRYQLDLKTATITSLFETYYDGEEYDHYSYTLYAIKLDHFSEQYIDRFKIISSISFKIYREFVYENFFSDYTELSKYLNSLFITHEYSKIKLCASEKIINELKRDILDPDKRNLISLNNIAYYFEQSGAFEGAIYILENLLMKFPSRTVAYLNLGDAYWGAKRTDDAKKTYKTYIEQMNAQGKGGKIPEYVVKRIE